MAIQTIDFNEWVKANPSVVSSAIKSNFLQAAKSDMVELMNQNLRPLQDGVYIGKIQKETWGSYMRIEPWQTTTIGIAAADADAIVVQFGGYRLGIALTEPNALKWGSSTTVRVNVADDLNSYDGKQLTANIMKNDAYKNDAAATYAVAYAYAYSKGHTGDPGGDVSIPAKSWWLPSMGDLALIHRYFETVNLALTRIKNAGKQTVTLLQRADYWSCCEGSAGHARRLHFSLGSRGNGGKGNADRVRPVTAF